MIGTRVMSGSEAISFRNLSSPAIESKSLHPCSHRSPAPALDLLARNRQGAFEITAKDQSRKRR